MTMSRTNRTRLQRMPERGTHDAGLIGEVLDAAFVAHDYDRPTWAGVLLLTLRAETPIPDPRLAESIAVPDYLGSAPGGNSAAGVAGRNQIKAPPPSRVNGSGRITDLAKWISSCRA